MKDSADKEISLCIIGNKVDLREQLPAERCVSTAHGERLAKVSFHSIKWEKMFVLHDVRVNQVKSEVVMLCLQVYGALFCETSAREGTNIVEAVLHLAR